MRAAKRKIKQSNGLSRFLLALAVSVFLLSMLVIGYKKQHYQTNLSISLAKAKMWFKHDKKNVPAAVIETPKQVAQNQAPKEEAPINFEFYTALSQMQIKTGANLTPAMKEIVKNKEKVFNPTEKNLPSKIKVVSEEELEKSISGELFQQAYAIQLGLFRSPAMAQQYKTTLSKQGLSVQVEKVTMAEKLFYRVQLGPFSTQMQAKSQLKELQLRGMEGIVIKLTA